MSEQKIHKGRCECGDVAFSLGEQLSPGTACHCSQCRRSSGHFWASGWVRNDALHIETGSPLTWYQSSPDCQRGFCSKCGSSLFWRKDGEGTVSVSFGSLDSPTGMKLERHIFQDDKGDYYDI